MTNKKGNPRKEAALIQLSKEFTGNSAKEQCLRLFKALQQFKINSYEASRFLAIYHPPARAHELRKKGHEISTVWETVEDESGILHRVGCYILRGANHE
ncbi:helix-turn-helix domain-containing protein [Methylotenera sp.]|uniref:helix-turn-helix domain-containing protein n=1 Tax=Methylotenera sp. TaxID=2051956 RepID=UPI002487B57B|nr:helix-turn-helix domain-containing protein [Methylotenera sp.]MDI1298142.1 helix-turn-helix domain-containing protein [Methylotenera sp.]